MYFMVSINMSRVFIFCLENVAKIKYALSSVPTFEYILFNIFLNSLW
jgi:hypothetical protein